MYVYKARQYLNEDTYIILGIQSDRRGRGEGAGGGNSSLCLHGLDELTYFWREVHL